MKLFTIIFSICFLIGCSFGGFKPPKPYYQWRIDKEFETSYEYVVFRGKEMRACGMNPLVGESGNSKVNLCFESKGWYLKGGPVCENKLMWNDELCIKWRAKHSKPDVKPWG